VKELFLLDPEVVYLNHGSFGACPRPVFEAYQRFQRELERQPVAFLALERGLPEALDNARRSLSAYLGADPANLSFAVNASTALNTVVRSLELRPGDEVLMGDEEYGGMERLWEYVSQRSGARIVRVPFDELEPGPCTRVVFCSHVEWSSGHVNDVAALCARTRDVGVLTIVDGAHAPGQLAFDLESLGADVYAGNCHKWMLCPKGSGFLYARPEVQALVDPLVISWDYVDGASFPERHRWQGTRDPSPYLAVPAAIDFMAEHDWPSVRARCHDLLASLELPFEPMTDDFVQMRGYALPPGTDGAALKQRLYDQYRVEVPIVETSSGWAMRVSVQAYNDDDDLATLARAVALQ
jgi:isopenicillin-N epimerase